MSQTIHLTTLEREIDALLDQPAARSRRKRDDVERTLTDGYAYLLRLQAERLRVEQALRESVRSTPPRRLTAADAARDLARVDLELARVRGRLATLRAHAL